LAEPLLLELDLLELLLLFEPELFDPPDLDADLAINALLLDSRLNRPGKGRFRIGGRWTDVPYLFSTNKCGTNESQPGGARPPS